MHLGRILSDVSWGQRGFGSVQHHTPHSGDPAGVDQVPTKIKIEIGCQEQHWRETPHVAFRFEWQENAQPQTPTNMRLSFMLMLAKSTSSVGLVASIWVKSLTLTACCSSASQQWIMFLLSTRHKTVLALTPLVWYVLTHVDSRWCTLMHVDACCP